MTEKERLTALFTDLGISFEQHRIGDITTVTIAAKVGNVRGYSGFAADFEFTSDGKFKEVGIWE